MKEKVEASEVCFEGEAMMWYRWLKQRIPMNQWEDLKGMILEHFRPADDGDLYEQWGTLADYRRELLTRLTYLESVEEGVVIGAFLRGLRGHQGGVEGFGTNNLRTSHDLG